jgi:hypothetical protein
LPNGTNVHESIAPGNAFPGTRRTFIAIAAGLGLSLCAQKAGQARSRYAPSKPPGAAKERVFQGYACDAATACASVHPKLFIPIRDSLAPDYNAVYLSIQGELCSYLQLF